MIDTTKPTEQFGAQEPNKPQEKQTDPKVGNTQDQIKKSPDGDVDRFGKSDAKPEQKTHVEQAPLKKN